MSDRFDHEDAALAELADDWMERQQQAPWRDPDEYESDRMRRLAEIGRTFRREPAEAA